MRDELSIGIDIGGTKIAFVVADRLGNVHHSKTIPTDGGAGFAAVMRRVNIEVARLMALHPAIAGIGAGAPGPVDSSRGVALQAANLGWSDAPVRDAISRGLTKPLPVFVENDVNAGAIGEGLFGAARGASEFVYLSVGTGMGGAVILDNRLLRGAAHSEMEIGHVSLDPVGGRECGCGGRGCLEMSISGKGLVAIARGNLAAFPDSALDENRLTTREIIRCAEAGDPLAALALDEAAVALGIACAWCVSLFNPRLIVLAGGLIHACYHLIEARVLMETGARCLAGNFQAVAIRRSTLADGALGAAALVWHHKREARKA